MGIDATFVDPLCTEEGLNAAFQPNTKVVFGETIVNPALTVLDIDLPRLLHARCAADREPTPASRRSAAAL